ncbi:type VII secretion protein EccB [Nocardioides sp. AE5]|uniref:type VII secretion protein EccB n=1 Tax=Nocardioides sp. AE5 TaxID=2962573 RepID=UPI002881EED3|nr:type VII secretion protein EccB [Nocardioides sp. AE5]MDT0202160.1 type VII secretion protein EccB [Nocardioides sp. AE5]
MQTRRDQLHAYRFMTRRAMSALVTGEPDAVEPPMRRITLMTVSGIMVAIIVAAVFAVIGLLKGGGSNDWQAEGAVVMEKETGARYVMIDGQLHPAVNYASAVLATGSTGPVEVLEASRGDLAKVDRGETIGVVGLPDSMPAPDDLVSGPVTVCSQPRVEGVNVTAVVHVDVGTDQEARLIDPEHAVYVESFEGERFLLYEGRRHPVEQSVEAALQISATPVKVASAFLTAVPMGPGFQTPRVPGAGTQVSLAGQDLVVGQVIEVDDGTFRVVLDQGVARVSEVQARLLRTAVLDGKRMDPVPMSFSSVIEMGEIDDSTSMARAAGMDGLPEVLPTIAPGAAEAAGACVVFGDESTPDHLALPGSDASSAPTSESEASRAGMADEVFVQPGKGLLAATQEGSVVYLVTGPGRAYPSQSIDLLGGFGYGVDDVVRIRAEVLGIIPDGAALDPVAARTPIGG